MKILALSCSPRTGGNTDLLLDEFLRGAQEHECSVEKLQVARLNIRPCVHCDNCIRNGVCSIKDDMQELYPKLLQADVLVLAAPIYFMAHCAQAKLLIDRCQVFWARRYRRNETLRDSPVKPRGIFISVGATHGNKVFAGAKTTMKWLFDALDMEYWDNLLFEGLDEKGAVHNHPTALKETYNLGRKIAQT